MKKAYTSPELRELPLSDPRVLALRAEVLDRLRRAREGT